MMDKGSHVLIVSRPATEESIEGTRVFYCGPPDGAEPSPTTEAVFTLLSFSQTSHDFAVEAAVAAAEAAAPAFFAAGPAMGTRSKKKAAAATPASAPGSGVTVPAGQVAPAPTRAATGAGVPKRTREPRRNAKGRFTSAPFDEATAPAVAGPSSPPDTAGPSFSTARATATGATPRPLVKYHTGELVSPGSVTNPKGGAHKYPRVSDEEERVIVTERLKENPLSFAVLGQMLRPEKGRAAKSWACNAFMAYLQAWHEKGLEDKRIAVAAAANLSSSSSAAAAAA